MEKIVCAAIQYLLKGNKKPEYITGLTHLDCINQFKVMNLPRRLRKSGKEIQGFLTSSGRFVDRVEACELAIKAGQIPKNYSRFKLFSEDIKDNYEDIFISCKKELSYERA